MGHFLNRTPIFWLMRLWGSKSKHHKDTCSKEIGLRFQVLIITPHSIMNITGRTYVSNYEITQTCISDNHKQIKEGPIFNPVFWRCFIVDLLMQHEFCCVNFIGRSRRTWKNKLNNTHIPDAHIQQFSLLCLTSFSMLIFKMLQSQDATWHLMWQKQHETHPIWRTPGKKSRGDRSSMFPPSS